MRGKKSPRSSCVKARDSSVLFLAILQKLIKYVYYYYYFTQKEPIILSLFRIYRFVFSFLALKSAAVE
jgi:hypothetical protein